MALELFISPAEITQSLDRSKVARLVNFDKEKVYKQSLLQFLEYGFQYVFPVISGRIVNGLYTSHSHPFMQNYFESNEPYVWPEVSGTGRGQSVMPLYKNAVKAAHLDATLYKMLALVDVIRIGKVREAKLAIKELKKIIKE